MNDNYEPLTVVASDGSVGIKRGCTKEDLIARLVELEHKIKEDHIVILPYNTGSAVNYGNENALISGYFIEGAHLLYIQLYAYERPEYRHFLIEPDDEKLVVPERKPRPIPDGMSLVKFEFKDEKERFYPEFDFDNDIKPVKVEEKSIGGFRNGTYQMP